MLRKDQVAFRRKALDLVEAGKSMSEIAAQLRESDQTIYKWRNHGRPGRRIGAAWVKVSSPDSCPLPRWVAC